MRAIPMDIFSDSPTWLLYLGTLLGPFVQEDAAVIAAASLSVGKLAKTLPIFILICIGLFVSDIWKYWIGWAATKNKGGQAFAEKKHIANMKEKVTKFTLATMLVARFVPLTRIPVYIACGFFGVPYLKYCLYIGFTAILYAGVIFSVFHALGAVLGEKILWVLPLAALIGLSLFIAFQFSRKRLATPKR